MQTAVVAQPSQPATQPDTKPAIVVTPEVTEQATPPDALGLFDLVLRGQQQLSVLLRHERALPSVTQRLLLLSLLGLAVHGLVVGLAAQGLGRGALSGLGLQEGHPALWMPIAFVAAFVGALAVCLPSFYFYTQLSGLDASFRLVTAQALRGQATTSVFLLGLCPFYAAVVLSAVVGVLDDSGLVLAVGLLLPFVVGLWGVHVLYRSFRDLASWLPVTHARRGNFLGRMILCWAAIYTAIAPVALFRLARALGPHI
jgi:hypothetical protein